MDSKAFKELQKTWYAKLAKKGFKDIERPDGGLTIWASRSKAHDRNEDVRGAKEEYYRRAGQFLYDHQFKTAQERFIWQKHSDGVSIRNIVLLLAKKKIKTYRSAVDNTISRLRDIMFAGNAEERKENYEQE